MHIKEVFAKKIKDSRGEYTIEVSVNACKASSPSGKSTGKYETPCYHKSLTWNVTAINNFKELKNLKINDFNDLKKIELLIKKKFKFNDVKKFGANALFALESAILKALAVSQKKELWQVVNSRSKRMPIPVGNAVGGGMHSHNKSHPVFQEFLLIPMGKTFRKNYYDMKTNYTLIGRLIGSKSINDEGAWQTHLNEEEIIQILSRLKNTNIGLDVAASSFYCKNEYCYNNKSLDKNAQIKYMNSLIKDYSIFYLEDPLEQEDFKGFSKLNKKFLIVGDDLTATHIARLKKSIKLKSINAIIIKPNQNGSLLELREIFELCKKKKIKTIISHRSGETLDSALADYAFGFGADYIKCGIATKWRDAKLKRLLEIENHLK